jgi:hypothetical protein
MWRSAVDGVTNYFVVRWKKRWPIVPATAIWVLLWALTDEKRVHGTVHRTVVGAVIFVIVGILFPLRWGGEDWKQPRAR